MADDPAAQVTGGGAATQNEQTSSADNAQDDSPDTQEMIKQAVEAATKDFRKRVRNGIPILSNLSRSSRSQP